VLPDCKVKVYLKPKVQPVVVAVVPPVAVPVVAVAATNDK
jgi:hypothetical protein